MVEIENLPANWRCVSLFRKSFLYEGLTSLLYNQIRLSVVIEGIRLLKYPLIRENIVDSQDVFIF